MLTVDLKETLAEAADCLAQELERNPEVLDKSPEEFAIDQLPTAERLWHRLQDVVAVVSDLKGSTKLGLGRNAQSTAAILEAASGVTVRIADRFGCDYSQVQGDGVVALFWGDQRTERAMCAAVTLQTYGNALTTRVHERWNEAPGTGIKIGIDRGRVLVKRVGLPGDDNYSDPVWIGRPVNYAAKAAQQAEQQQILVTRKFWESISSNDFVAYSCGCVDGVPGHTPSPLWSDTEILKLPQEDNKGYLLKSAWCERHGEGFCEAILSNQRSRKDVADLQAKRHSQALTRNREQMAANTRNRRLGLA